MTYIITSHGLRFAIESDGFTRSNAEADFERGKAAIEAALDALPAANVAAMHAADRDWQSRDCEGDRPAEIDRLEAIGHKAATDCWHNPSAVSISISAAI